MSYPMMNTGHIPSNTIVGSTKSVVMQQFILNYDCVPSVKDNKALHTWCAEQRRSYNTWNKRPYPLDVVKIMFLEALPYWWWNADDNWVYRYVRVLNYVLKNGDYPKGNNVMRKWLASQKTQTATMNVAKLSALTMLPNTTWDNTDRIVRGVTNPVIILPKHCGYVCDVVQSFIAIAPLYGYSIDPWVENNSTIAHAAFAFFHHILTPRAGLILTMGVPQLIYKNVNLNLYLITAPSTAETNIPPDERLMTYG